LINELTIVVPTYNEYESVGPLIIALDSALAGISWEVIFVDDDSNDGTANLVRQYAQEDGRVRCIQRLQRRGLSSACIEGMLASSSPYIAVLDADMQHDETLLPLMLTKLQEDNYDVVVGSRYMDGGDTGELVGLRLLFSKMATALSQFLLRLQFTDPMSGFFMLKREFLEGVIRKVYGKGFKILLDLCASSERPIRSIELPYTMRARQLGESKLGIKVTLEFFMLLLYKTSGRLIPGRFIKFSAVGLVGVGVHFVALTLIYLVLGNSFVFSQALGTALAMTNNFILNNQFTYQDQKLRGKQFFIGLIKFYMACSLGAVISVALGGYLHSQLLPWWLAGLIGAVAAAVWNYMSTAAFAWGGSARSSGRTDNR